MKQLTQNNEKTIWTDILPKRYADGKQHVQMYLMLLDIWEMQIKAIVKLHYKATRMLKTNNDYNW
jgi:hypothetical protein